MEKEKVRVRFAPSPTGALHIGGVRTALYNFLFARKNNGVMILRIEDTDQNRYVPGAEEYIKETLEWLGIQLDESPWHGGPHAPYRQSERKDIYKDFAMKLVAEGNAYYAFDTAEELEEMRKRLEAAKVPNPAYNSITRNTMKNSLTLPEDEVKRLLESGTPYVIRLKVPRKEEIRLYDLVRGWVLVHSSTLDDKVLMKSDGMPTYHLANVVDDYLMGITHVIRGEEWLPSAPIHVLLYKYLGLENKMPKFAHLPLLLKPDGNGKLSKRDADMHGFPVFPLKWMDENGQPVMSFKEEGYLPEALINFLAFLGWNPGNNKELFSLNELIEEFSIERISKSGAKFDIAKAKWFNQQYLRKKPDQEIANYLADYLKNNNIAFSENKLLKIVSLVKERLTFIKDIIPETTFFFQRPGDFDKTIISAKWSQEALIALTNFLNALNVPDKGITLSAEVAKKLWENTLESNNIKPGKVMQLLRLALTGRGSGPDLMSIIEILGLNETKQRIELALKIFPKLV